MSGVAVVVFTKDLRVHDNPALTRAIATADEVVPLFVLDDALLASTPAVGVAFLLRSLRDLQESLRERGADLVVRRGAWVAQVLAAAAEFGATEVHVADDVSGLAERLDALELARGRIAVHRHPGVTVVPPGEVVPTGRDSYSVFTPFWRRWAAHPWRAVLPAPRTIATPAAVGRNDAERLFRELPSLLPGGVEAGETRARRQLARWLRSGISSYEQTHNDLGAAATSRFSASLHLGCLSALEVAVRSLDHDGGEPFVRQLAWRDFFYQFVAPRPELLWQSYRADGDAQWRVPRDARLWDAWADGRTGYPIVDAAMRQLHSEGFVHNRARMVAASFLTKDLGQPWQAGAQHYLDHLVDGDVVVNNMNWQWVAGTGTDTNRHRVLSPQRQAERFDPDGIYTKRYLPELSKLPGRIARDPDRQTRLDVGYPQPVVEPASARRTNAPSDARGTTES